ncbi:MAG: class GN sortase [Granulosicoccus sp.]
MSTHQIPFLSPSYAKHAKLYSYLILSLGLVTLILATISGSRAAYLDVKALASQWLMQRAWEDSLDNAEPAKPWSWADTKSTARLSYTLTENSAQQSLIVLDNASGEAMAFGPGLVAGKLANAASETIAVGGHRDTHLAFLEHANQQTRFELQIVDGRTLHYRFEDSFVVDSGKEILQIATDKPGLVLITCYPFNAMQTGGPLRLVTRARLVDT